MATLFDGSGADPAPGDAVVSDGRIVEAGLGPGGDEGVDCAGRTIPPGLFESASLDGGPARALLDDGRTLAHAGDTEVLVVRTPPWTVRR